MRAARHLFFLWTTAALLAGCASVPRDVSKIRLGMTKSELTHVMGKPAKVKGPFRNDNGRTEEIWEYVVGPDEQESGRDVAVGVLTSDISFFQDPTEDRHFQCHFIDDRLAHWDTNQR